MERNMNTLIPVLTSTLALLFGGACLWLFAQWRREQARTAGLQAELAGARAMLQAQTNAQATIAETLKAQAAQSAQAVAEQLVQRATETFQAQDRFARERIESQLKPVKDTLEKFEKQVQLIEKARAEDTGGLKTQIAQLMQASAATQEEARRLSTALRRGAGVQGRWGEQVLRNVLDLAGLNRGYDYHEQASTPTETGRVRPDVVVKLPGNAAFVIDAKVSLNAYMDAQDATDDTARELALAKHAQSLKAHVADLSSKGYWDAIREVSPDFVAMFVPGDGILAAALERNPDLLNHAMKERVIIVTPTTLFALCKAVAYGWRVAEQSENAAKVVELGKELHKRLADMSMHVSALGKALGAATGKYNDFIGSLERRVLSTARKFGELKVDHEGKELEELRPLETAVRSLERLGVEDKPQLEVVID